MIYCPDTVHNPFLLILSAHVVCVVVIVSHPVGGAECAVTLCDMESGSTTHKLRFHSKPVLALAWSPLSDHMLASAGQDGAIALWDVRRASGPLRQLDQHNSSGSSNMSTGKWVWSVVGRTS